MDKQEITLKVTVEQANIILASLAKQPFETVADVIGSIRQQAQEQLQAQPAIEE